MSLTSRSRKSHVVIHASAAVPTPQAAPPIQAALDAVSGRFAPWVGRRQTLLTFEEEQPGLRHTFTDPVADRLADVTARYDPDRLLVANHIAY